MSIASPVAEVLSFVCTLVRERSAIELDASKTYLIEARLAPLAKQHGFATVTDFVIAVRTRRQREWETLLVEAMTTNETSFFRDVHPFEALKTTILGELRKRSAAAHTINIWSAASSTGQELYSVAMLLHEHFPDLATWKVQLLGTDLSEEVLRRAREARFTQLEVNRGLPAPLLAKYFQRDGMFWQLRPELRSMSTFRKMNLIETWPAMPLMDVVFLRNVLIYFSTDMKRRILQKVRRIMAPQGALFLGAAETTMNLDSSFERVQVGNCVYYRPK